MIKSNELQENPPEYLAHLKEDAPDQWRFHPLEEHLRDVGLRSGEFATIYDINSGAWAILAGIWHDLGKYSPKFQHRIKSNSGFDPDANLEGVAGRPNHSSAGALYARKWFVQNSKNGDSYAKVLGYLIAGHHSGLANWSGNLANRLDLKDEENKQYLKDALDEKPPEDILKPTALYQLKPPASFSKETYRMARSFWIRMLFSCLVDADFLDTEEFMDLSKSDLRKQWPPLEDFKAALDCHMAAFSQKEQTPLNQLRQEILASCLQKSSLPSGIYKLTVPTGGGKTLSGLNFALNHALHHGKKRIIYVLPFTSILEQTAEIFRNAFASIGPDFMIEHYSAMDPSRDTNVGRLATENWDAPIILTTNIQFFESLFACRTSRCRKLHNIANSVVILDEAQQIPSEFKELIEEALNLLASQYNTTIVLSTATQPALKLTYAGELAPNPEQLFQILNRVQIVLPPDRQTIHDWETLAKELTSHPKVLCIVNSRPDAQALHSLMPKGTYHLSALMCPVHRSKVLKEIKTKLHQSEINHSDEPIRVISTQVVEAGVDIDFPVLYRAMAGLDSITQAAGRCNREGRLESLGQMVVFNPPKTMPFIRKAVDTTWEVIEDMEFLGGKRILMLSAALFEKYFDLFYSAQNSLDKHGILDMLSLEEGKHPHFQFRDAADKFNLIDDTGWITIIIPYDDFARKELDKIPATKENKGFLRSILRQLQRYTVSIPERQFQAESMAEVLPGLYRLKPEMMTFLYQDDTGLEIGKTFTADSLSLIF